MKTHLVIVLVLSVANIPSLRPVFEQMTRMTAANRKPQRQLSIKEMNAAYFASVAQIQQQLKAPAAARYAPINEAQFFPDVVLWENRDLPLNNLTIGVSLWVDSQNSFGAMLRTRYACNVTPLVANPLGPFHTACYEIKVQQTK